ncbi:hypothetical protein DL766_008961 [Monosporascus sp. MC13-8B]|nr:hypothetical protein DL763_008779 [Monosporascus cannonballus]RYP17176.1 hypothetical protein DL766_008961 [Monosporascus sp. MC13-8B]
MTEPPAKRRRLSDGDGEPSARGDPARVPKSLSRAVSPPTRKKKEMAERVLIPSPFRLTTIRDLPQESNTDAVSLGDLLGDPLIAECWEFNYLHDVDFLLSHFDEDTRSLTKVHIVHGFWKREDPNRLFLEAAQYSNVTLHTAFMPEMFGTHHSKMLILIRHDDTAQVIIHTANMIAKDWTNMTNGAWVSPLLLRSATATAARDDAVEVEATDAAAIGSGERFKADLLSYLRAYNAKRDVCGPLVGELRRYDFSAVRGALVASVPGKHDVDDEPQVTRWGWAAARHALRTVPCHHDQQAAGKKKAEIVAQVSSIATLGASDAWLRRTLFEALSATAAGTGKPKPDVRVMFPTADEIRRSLDGYASGGSIHTKIQSAQQKKQLQYLRPIFCHWANDCDKGVLQDGPAREGGRKRAAPHIKTYIRYCGGDGNGDGERTAIDWALLTSANISKQAWGEAATNNGSGQIRIASWEIGVLVWPELLAGRGARMVGMFGRDLPGRDDLDGDGPLVGLRVPYSLPLQRYGDGEVPWVATASYSEPDWKGQTWEDP